MAKATANVSFVRAEIKKLAPLYQLIRDCIEGETAVKRAGQKYLPKPNPSDDSKENADRYDSYKERAVFYNVTKRTLAGLIGQIFSREPEAVLPTLLEILREDADGGAVSLEQLAKRAAIYVLAFGRAGLLTDYPNTEVPTSKGDQERGEMRPTITAYAPWDVINWRKTTRGAKAVLCLVVLREDWIYSDDGFEMKKGDQWRVLQLVENAYCVSIYRKTNGLHELVEGPYFPTDANGNYLTEIPFTFIGADNNDDGPDSPPLYDIASLNIAHYRNSADYEESCFIVGQPTPYFSGLTEEWVKDVLKGSVQLGARAAIPLPEGGSAGLLQAEPNSMAKEAMEHKEKQMTALGAKLVQEKEVQRTATEASFENASETSTLASSANNVSSAFNAALKWCGLFAGTTEEATFKLHTDFAVSKLSPEEQKQLVADWQGGAITFGEMRENFRRAGIATVDDEEAKAAIAAELSLIPGMNEPGAGAV